MYEAIVGNTTYWSRILIAASSQEEASRILHEVLSSAAWHEEEQEERTMSPENGGTYESYRLTKLQPTKGPLWGRTLLANDKKILAKLAESGRIG